MAHGVSAMRMSSSVCHLTFSFLMFHPSLLLLFLDGHFETIPDYDLIDFDVHDFLPNFPDPEAQVNHTPHKHEQSGYLAKSALNTEPEGKAGATEVNSVEPRYIKQDRWGQEWLILDYCASFACSVTRSTTTEFQHHDIMMKTTVQNDLRLEMALESVWIVCAHEKSNNKETTENKHAHVSNCARTSTSLCLHKSGSTGLFQTSSCRKHFDFLKKSSGYCYT